MNYRQIILSKPKGVLIYYLNSMLVVFELSVISRMNIVDCLFVANRVSSWERFMWGGKKSDWAKIIEQKRSRSVVFYENGDGLLVFVVILFENPFLKQCKCNRSWNIFLPLFWNLELYEDDSHNKLVYFWKDYFVCHSSLPWARKEVTVFVQLYLPWYTYLVSIREVKNRTKCLFY